MDKKSVQHLIQRSLTSIDVQGISVSFESESVIRAEIVSNSFKGIKLTKRSELLRGLLDELAINELSDYQLVLNALTVSESLHGISETGTSAKLFGASKSNVAAQASL